MMKLFDSNETLFSSNGLGIINPLKCIETKRKSFNGWFVDVELSSKYASLIKQDMIVYVETKEKGGQPFRIANISKKDKKITFQANHIAFDAENYFLLDVRPTNLSPVSYLNWLNDRTDKKSPFYVTSNVSGRATTYFIRKTLLDGFIQTEETFGGTFDIDKFNISLFNKVGNDNGYSIVYGKNLQGISVIEDWSGVVTRLYPTGPDGIMLQEKFIESDVQYDKPYTKTVPFDINTSYEDQNGNTIELDETEILSELRRLANEYIEKNKYPLINYSVKSDINQDLCIGDVIHIKHPFVSIKTEVQEYSYNILTKRVEKLIFGNYERNVKKAFDKIKDQIETNDQIVRDTLNIVIEQTDLINNLNKNGFVYIDDNEILVLDKLPKEDAKNVWRFGLGGLGFSSNGYKGPFDYAFTKDGKINADFIKANSITVNKIASDVGSSLDISSNESIKLLTRSQQEITEYVEKSLYSLTVQGNGNVIKNENDSITLKAMLFYKGENITKKSSALLFNWKRESENKSSDTVWNNTHKGMKNVVITSDDVDKYAVFSLECNVLVDVLQDSYMTIVDETDIPKLSLSLDSNMPIQQVETNGNLWPVWNPLIITPDIKNGVAQILLDDSNLVVTFKRIVDGVETDLMSSKEIIENNCLKVSENVLSSIISRNITYKCYASYKGYEISQQLSFSLVRDGQQGKPGTSGITYYTWIMYADDENGTGMSDNPINKNYIGIAYNKTQETPLIDPSQYRWSKIKGEQGIQGPKGADGKQYYTWLKYADTPTTGMSDNPTGKAYIGLAYNKETTTESNNYSDYTWSLIKGPKGDQGVAGGKGADGTTFYTWIKYATSSSGANMSDDSTGKSYIGLAYNKATSTESTNAADYTWSLIKGDKGDAGKGIKSITNYYLAIASSSGVTTSTSGWTTSVQSVSLSKKYLWNYEVVTFTDNSTIISTPCIIGAYGDTGPIGAPGATGVGISAITEYYQVSTSNTAAPTSWVTTPPSMTETNKYLWNYEVIKYTNNTTKETAKRVIGVYGNKGNTGATGPQGPIGESLGQGKVLFKDPTFIDGMNGAKVYNNSGNGNVVLERIAREVDCPSASDYQIRIKNIGTSSPGCGGFYWGHASRANAVFIYRLIAKIPVGRKLLWATNATGTGGNTKWLTSNAGTGKYEEYIFKLVCGNTGTFSSTGYFYIDGAAGTTDMPDYWHIAYATCFDMTDVPVDIEELIEKTKVDIKTQYDTDIEILRESITAFVNENTVLKTDYNTKITDIENKMVLTKDYTEFIKSTSQTIKNIEDGKVDVLDLLEWARFNGSTLELGASKSNFKAILTTSELGFYDNNTKIAWFSNQELHTVKAIRIGSPNAYFRFVKEANDSFSLE